MHLSGFGHRRLAPLKDRSPFSIPSHRLAAITLLALTLGLVAAFLVARGSAAGADALAYWNGVHVWLAGGDPYRPPGSGLPYLYAPWLLPLFLPWAALPWPIAWFAWRSAMVLGFAWSLAWAYRRRPAWTAVLVLVLAIPLAATLDTGNVTLFLALGIWFAQSSGPRAGGALWALATAMKWVPVVLWPILPARTRRWGLAALGIAVLLSLATWPQTLEQIQAAAASGPPNFPRPLRIDHALLIWGAVPWLWREDLGDVLRGWWRGALRWQAVLRWRRPALRSATSDAARGVDAGPES